MFTAAVANEVKRAMKCGAVQKLRKRDESAVRGGRKIAVSKVWFNEVLTLN